MDCERKAAVLFEVSSSGLNGSSVISASVDGRHIVSFRARSDDDEEALKELCSMGLVQSAIISTLIGKFVG